MNFPSVIVWITGLIVFLFYKSERKFRVLALLYLITTTILLISRGKSYYTLGLYPILFIMGGYSIEKYFNKIFKYIFSSNEVHL